MQAVEPPAIEEERLQAGGAGAIGGIDPADEDRVITTRIGVDDRALELGQGVLENGQTQEALAIVGALELLGPACRRREAPREQLVIAVDHVDRSLPVRV